MRYDSKYIYFKYIYPASEVGFARLHTHTSYKLANNDTHARTRAVVVVVVGTCVMVCTNTAADRFDCFLFAPRYAHVCWCCFVVLVRTSQSSSTTPTA